MCAYVCVCAWVWEDAWKRKECWWASQSVCLHSSLSGRDVHRANEKHMRPPVLCQLVMYPHARSHVLVDTHAYSSKFLALPSVLFLSFMFQELLDWIRPVLVSVRYSALSVMPMTSHPLPHGALYTYTGDSETPEVYRTVHQRLRGHLRQSHIQAKKAFYAASPPRGILWENTDYFIRIVVGGDGRIYEGMRVTERAMNASVGSGQYICLRAVITLGFW